MPAYRSTATDRDLAPARTVVTVGPVDGLTVAGVQAVLDRAVAVRPDPRLALRPDAGARRWDYDADTVRGAVTDRPDLDTTDLGRLVSQIRSRPGARRPIEVFVCGQFLVLDYSHGIGDGQFGTIGLAELARGAQADVRLLADGLPRGAVWTALRRHFGAHPGAVRRFLELRAHHRGADTAAAERRITDWEPTKRSITRYLDPEKTGRLRTWVKQHCPGATTASVSVDMWLSALQAEGVAFDERVMILMNCRRYLAAGYATAQGNFAVGIPLRIPRQRDPAMIAASVRAVLDSGWPLAILGMAEISAIRGNADPPSAAASVEVPNRLRLAVSDLGTLRVFDGVPFATNRPAQLSAFLEPDGPDAATLLVSELNGGRTFTASFCTAMIDAEVIERAVDRMCDDPIALVSGGQVAQ
ncbi:hypothetical protein [Mycolicibacterium bacteremicum]|uniref:Condensation domain-containing protein n=1 Tax=Mycolicibacterium bacteremicum TaxID=564198 RepID=A0A1W9Z108_MYCBA|nr:hypothetical protein [Mycolicibacterium bacteremicum]MCV7434690.1 hypothetical protein [Mycolicibacterium bacteremicum]ORA05700.1 hypothetical protein BST17_07960 [Mycolicibacterium bacteremicum]